jgi:nucleoside 2-deoxyribosyltransferase
MPAFNGHTVYCAGPMFSPGDLGEMNQIKDELEGAGYHTYLPQRDGIEVAQVMKGLESGTGMTMPPSSAQQVTDLMRKAVFSLDLFQLLSRCDCVVFNMNGRVPDDGGVAETSMAFAAGKPVVIYKDDPITILMGLDNPLVQGLSYTWEYAESYAAIAPKLTAFLAQYQQLWGPPPEPKLSAYVTGAIAIGQQVWTELLTLRSQTPDDPIKVTYGVIGWLLGPDIQAAFAKVFPKATASS